ncbi:MAG: hypothetical protein KJZ54_13840 [Phycisphaerales bacterium]|nr:hypothetical protein [Phycisphaerales bacterium]
MPVTVTYDLADADGNQRNYIRSMFERFHWRRLGGSVLRYEGEQLADGATGEEDWFNHVAPALMFMRAYCLRHNITIRFFTLDASGVAHIDHSDPALPLGTQPQAGASLSFADPTNQQSSQQTIRDSVDAMTNAI